MAKQKVALECLSYHATASQDQTVKLASEQIKSAEEYKLYSFKFIGKERETTRNFSSPFSASFQLKRSGVGNFFIFATLGCQFSYTIFPLFFFALILVIRFRACGRGNVSSDDKDVR
jgi:hypothetical protein